MESIRQAITPGRLSGIFSYVVLLALMTGNVFLIRQNWQLRAELNKRKPDNLQRGDVLIPVTAWNSHGENVSLSYKGNEQSRVLLFFSPQ